MNTEELTQLVNTLKKQVDDLKASSVSRKEYNDLREKVNKTSFSGIEIFNRPVRVTAPNAAMVGGKSALFIGSGPFGIYYGSGVPTISASKGSIYMRSEGSSTSTRAYINTDGGTTWTNITTGA